jgi:hypothetical protein
MRARERWGRLLELAEPEPSGHAEALKPNVKSILSIEWQILMPRDVNQPGTAKESGYKKGSVRSAHNRSIGKAEPRPMSCRSAGDRKSD